MDSSDSEEEAETPEKRRNAQNAVSKTGTPGRRRKKDPEDAAVVSGVVLSLRCGAF